MGGADRETVEWGTGELAACPRRPDRGHNPCEHLRAVRKSAKQVVRDGALEEAGFRGTIAILPPSEDLLQPICTDLPHSLRPYNSILRNARSRSDHIRNCAELVRT